MASKLLRPSIADILTNNSAGQTISKPTKGKIGVLLINTGTPQANTFFSIFTYLKQFLLDRRVIEAPRAIWYPLLFLYILPTRPLKKQKSYALIWNKQKDESPLRTIIKSQSRMLEQRLANHLPNVEIIVDWAFRYGGPSVDEKVMELQTRGCDRLISLPIFPQYSATTVGTMNDQVFNTLKSQRHQMSVRTVCGYYENDVFLDAITKSIKNKMKAHGDIQFDVIVLTYHGIPLSYAQRGDPYDAQCHKTTELVRSRLNTDIPVISSFQSRFGGSVWLQPYTESLVLDLARNSYKNLIIAAPGFSADCLETLEEIEIDLKNDFQKHGGDNLIYVPCLNESPKGIDVLESVVKSHIVNF